MHILHVIPGDLWAGAESQVFYTLREIICSSDHNITVILFNRSELYKRLLEEKIAIQVFDENKLTSYEIIRRIRTFLSENKVDIIHTHEYKSHILSTIGKLVSKKKCPVIRTLHGRTTVPFNLKYLKSYLVLKMDFMFLRFLTRHIIAVSKDLQAELENCFPGTRIYQINNAVDLDYEEVPGFHNIRENLGISDSAFWVVTAARLVGVKNIDMLIEATDILDKTNTDLDFQVSIFGDGELKEHLGQKIKHYSLEKRVHLHGHHNDILAVFKSADVFTLTSTNEGLPMSLLEAMSLGAVPVCTCVGGMKEVIDHGQNGFLVEPGNAAELAERFNFLYQNRKKIPYFRENAKKKIRDSYSIRKSTEQLLNLYSCLCKKEVH